MNLRGRGKSQVFIEACAASRLGAEAHRKVSESAMASGPSFTINAAIAAGANSARSQSCRSGDLE